AYACSANTSYTIVSSDTTGAGQQAKILQQFASPLSVHLKDACTNGNASNVSVTFTFPPSDLANPVPSGFFGNQSSVTVTTNGSGIATTNQTLVANYVVGTFNVNVTAPGLTPTPYQISLTNTVGDPASITAGKPDSTNLGGPVAVN